MGLKRSYFCFFGYLMFFDFSYSYSMFLPNFKVHRRGAALWYEARITARPPIGVNMYERCKHFIGYAFSIFLFPFFFPSLLRFSLLPFFSPAYLPSTYYLPKKTVIHSWHHHGGISQKLKKFFRETSSEIPFPRRCTSIKLVPIGPETFLTVMYK